MILSLFPQNSVATLIKTFIVLSATLFLACAHAKQPVQTTYNIPYNAQTQLLNLYLPASRDKATAIMFIHGGGFSDGNKEEMAAHAKHYAEQGFVTTSINYRLSINHTHPIAINDAADALKWMKKNAGLYGYDQSKIIVVGYSAGGTIALNVGLEHANNVAAIVDVAGISDIGKLIDSDTVPNLKSDMNKYMDGKDPILASPITQVSKDAPPTLVIHGKEDYVVPIWQSIELVDKLEEYDAPVTFKVIHHADHNVMLTDSQYIDQLLSAMTAFIMTIENN